MRQVWAEVDLNAVAHNLHAIRRVLPEHTKIMAIVKANAYGHGALKVCHKLAEAGVDYFAVATLQEALQLQEEQLNLPILILGNTAREDYGIVVSSGVTQTIYSYEQAESLSIIASALKHVAKVHIKVDTGMSRIGFLDDERSLEEIIAIAKLPNLDIEGVFSHLANSDAADKTFSEQQISRYLTFCAKIERAGIHFKFKHIANSGAVLNHPESHLDIVRTGLILYGVYPSHEVNRELIKLKPALSLKSRIINLKELPKDTNISYGCTFTTQRPSKIATLPLGYADGYSRLLSNKAYVLVAGYKAPIVGRVCMDQCMIDVTDIPQVKLGDEVVHIGQQGEHEITAEDLAEIMGTVNYEILCMISYRVPRIYV
jgi:alanine racemase